MPTSAVNAFFEHPILNSPYECPSRHWELAADTKNNTFPENSGFHYAYSHTQEAKK